MGVRQVLTDAGVDWPFVASTHLSVVATGVGWHAAPSCPKVDERRRPLYGITLGELVDRQQRCRWCASDHALLRRVVVHDTVVLGHLWRYAVRVGEETAALRDEHDTARLRERRAELAPRAEPWETWGAAFRAALEACEDGERRAEEQLDVAELELWGRRFWHSRHVGCDDPSAAVEYRRWWSQRPAALAATPRHLVWNLEAAAAPGGTALVGGHPGAVSALEVQWDAQARWTLTAWFGTRFRTRTLPAVCGPLLEHLARDAGWELGWGPAKGASGHELAERLWRDGMAAADAVRCAAVSCG